MLIVFAYAILIAIVGSQLKRQRKKRLRSLKEQYYRAVPYEGPWENLYALMEPLTKDTITNFQSAFFLKWIKDGILVPAERDRKNRWAYQVLNADKESMWEGEEEFYDIIWSATDRRSILTEKSMKKYFRSNQRPYVDFLKNFASQSEKKMKEEGYLQNWEKFGQKYLIPTMQGEELENRLTMFKNFLKDYSLLAERESPNVYLWREYMIYAAILGIADQVEKEFAKLHPELVQETFAPEAVYIANSFANTIRRHAATSLESSSGRSSGGGGYSSGGGGGGSFGGGSGGGTR